MPEITKIKTLSRSPYMVAINSLRRRAGGPRILEDATGRVAGAVFVEYAEVWRRRDNVELSTNIEMVLQVPTGRRFEYVDRITSERYDEYERSRTDAMPYVASFWDGMYHRLRLV